MQCNSNPAISSHKCDKCESCCCCRCVCNNCSTIQTLLSHHTNVTSVRAAVAAGVFGSPVCTALCSCHSAGSCPWPACSWPRPLGWLSGAVATWHGTSYSPLSSADTSWSSRFDQNTWDVGATDRDEANQLEGLYWTVEKLERRRNLTHFNDSIHRQTERE